MKIGILGGRFDPPHLGHLAAAQQALEKAGMDEVWFVPYNTRNLLKNYELRIADYENIKATKNKQRLEMTRLAIGGYKKFRVLDIEIKRGGVSYTIDTIHELKEKYPQDEFYVIVGQDLVEELPKWKEYGRLTKMVDFYVVPRNGKVGATRPVGGQVHELPLQTIRLNEVSNLSSTIIRERVGRGLPIKGMVEEGVEKYIEKHNLYKRTY